MEFLEAERVEDAKEKKVKERQRRMDEPSSYVGIFGRKRKPYDAVPSPKQELATRASRRAKTCWPMKVAHTHNVGKGDYACK